MARILIIGAGIIGVTTAYAMARRGHDVTIVDRNDGPALGASHANGAQLSYAYADALASPALLRSLPRLIAGRDPLYKVRLSADPAFLRWGMAFVAASTAAAQRQSTLATLALALESQAAMAALLERHPIGFDHQPAGKMHLYFTPEAMAAARATVAIKQAHGVEQQLLDADAARAIEPMLARVDGLVGVVHSPGDSVGDPLLFARELLAVTQQAHGAKARFGVEIARIDPATTPASATTTAGERIEADLIVMTTGPQAVPLLAAIGINVPVLPMKGYSFTAPPGPNPPSTSLTDTKRKIVICRLGNRIRIAGIAEIGVKSADIDPVRMDALIGAARTAFPGAADYDRIEHRWAGLRPMTPRSVPIITQPRAGLLLNIGHGMLGWTLAMGSAERAAQLIATR